MRLLRINNKNRNSLEGICKFVNKIDFFSQYLDVSLRPHSLRRKNDFLYSFVPKPRFNATKLLARYLSDRELCIVLLSYSYGLLFPDFCSYIALFLLLSKLHPACDAFPFSSFYQQVY